MPRKTALRSVTSVLLLAVLLGCATTPAPPSEGHVTTDDGVRLWYRSFGAGDETVLVPLVTWNQRAFEAAARSHRFIFYDPRSRGRSDASETLGLERDLADLDAVRRHFGLQRVHLIGTSYYGALVALYAARHPEAVDRVVMVGPLPPRAALMASFNPPEKAGRISPEDRARVERIAAGGGADPVADCEAYWKIHSAEIVGSPEAANNVEIRCDAPNEYPWRFLAWAGKMFTSTGGWDWREQARSLRRPVLVIQGGKDLIVPVEGAREWAGNFPEGRLWMLPEAGHVPWFEVPDLLLPNILGFFDGRWPDEATKVTNEALQRP
jgi:proline iminopeptidase